MHPKSETDLVIVKSVLFYLLVYYQLQAKCVIGGAYV